MTDTESVIRKKLTKRVVEDAKPAGQKDVWLWDSQLPGFGLRVKPSGHKSYLVQYRDENRRTRRVTIARVGVLTAEQARTEAQQLLAAVARGENPAERKLERRELPTIEDLAERYIKEYAELKKKPKSIYEDELMLNRIIKPAFKGRPVASITEDDVAALHFKLRKTPVQANRVVALLSRMFSLAELPWRWRPRNSNPCWGLEKYEEKPRKRYLSEAELDWIGKALKAQEATEHWAPLLALRLLLLTGARVGEILSLKWEYVDLQKGVLRLPDSKTGQKEIVLGPPAVRLLDAAPGRKAGNSWVLPRQADPTQHLAGLQAPWKRLKAKVDQLQDEAEERLELKKKDRVDLSDLRLHDLRHSYASVGAAGGLSLHIIGSLLGHTQAQTTQRYAHLANDPLRQAAGVIAGHIAAVLDGEPAGEVVAMDREAGEA